MGKLTIYLAKDEEEKIKAIKNALLNEIPEVSVDFSKSRIVRMAIDKLYSILYHDKAGKK
ncbi:MAG: hypothetical protein QXO32_06625 [Candidatus Bathyarchaeia archaeon]